LGLFQNSGKGHLTESISDGAKGSIFNENIAERLKNAASSALQTTFCFESSSNKINAASKFKQGPKQKSENIDDNEEPTSASQCFYKSSLYELQEVSEGRCIHAVAVHYDKDRKEYLNFMTSYPIAKWVYRAFSQTLCLFYSWFSIQTLNFLQYEVLIIRLPIWYMFAAK